MRHKYADLFKAKLDNTDLVLFEKHFDWDKWRECKTDTRDAGKIFFVSDNFEYFLCLPQHNKDGQCLHWLNGGDAQEKGVNANDDMWSDEFADVVWSKEWHENHIFMDEALVTRIKPRKEKRWIGILPNGETTDAYDDEQLAYTEASERALEWQIIETEIEV